jgi:predicted permease
MTTRTGLRILFTFILVTLAVYTSWASTQQAVWDWQGLLVPPDRWWTIATLIDAYFGFITFYAWVFYKERSTVAKLGWFLAIMLLGNMAMAAYVLRELGRLRDDEPASAILLRRAA